MIVASTLDVSAARKMLIEASFNPTDTDLGVSVAIRGRVFEANNISVPNAVISIQVNDPQGTSIHVAIAYTNFAGVFLDAFLIAKASPGGNYTAYFAADKPGYDTARLTLTFTYATPDFSITSSADSLSLQQGQSGSVTVTVLSLRGFNQPVNLTAIDLPQGVTVQFDPVTVNPSSTSIANVVASSTTEPGNYTITLLAVSGSLTHKTTLRLIIQQGPLQADFTTLLVGSGAFFILIGIAFSIARSRVKRKEREAALEKILKPASTDTGYVATARVIATLEELRAMGQVDETTYQKLRKEYERRLEKSK